MSALAAGLPQLSATVGTSLEAIGDVIVEHPSRDHLTHAEAVALTAEIRAGLADLAAMVEAIGELVAAAWAMRADVVLGYGSWEAYCADLFAAVRSTRLPVDTRRAVVVALRGAGMSTRAAASALGVGNKTVARDLQASASVSPDTDDGRSGAVLGLDGRRRAARTGRRAPATAGDASTTTSTPLPKTLRALELLGEAEDGLTWSQLSQVSGWHHGVASATLTRLHQSGRVERRGDRREGCAVYRLPLVPPEVAPGAAGDGT